MSTMIYTLIQGITGALPNETPLTDNDKKPSLAKQIKDGEVVILATGYKINPEVKGTNIGGKGNVGSDEGNEVELPNALMSVEQNAGEWLFFSAHDNPLFTSLQEVRREVETMYQFREGADRQILGLTETNIKDVQAYLNGGDVRHAAVKGMFEAGQTMTRADVLWVFNLYLWGKVDRAAKEYSSKIKEAQEYLGQLKKAGKAEIPQELITTYSGAIDAQALIKASSAEGQRKDEVEVLLEGFAKRPEQAEKCKALTIQIKTLLGEDFFNRTVLRKFGLNAVDPSKREVYEAILALQIAGLLINPHLLMNSMIDLAVQLSGDQNEAQKIAGLQLPKNVKSVDELLVFYQGLNSSRLTLFKKWVPQDLFNDDPKKPKLDGVEFYKRLLRKRYENSSDRTRILSQFQVSLDLLLAKKLEFPHYNTNQFGRLKTAKKAQVKTSAGNLDGYQLMTGGEKETQVRQLTNDLLLASSKLPDVTYEINGFRARLAQEDKKTSLLAEVLTRNGGTLTASLYERLTVPVQPLVQESMPSLSLPSLKIEEHKLMAVLSQEVLPWVGSQGIDLSVNDAIKLLAPFRTGQTRLAYSYKLDKESYQITDIELFELPIDQQAIATNLKPIENHALSKLLEGLVRYGQNLNDETLKNEEDYINQAQNIRTVIGQAGTDAYMTDITLLAVREIVSSGAFNDIRNPNARRRLIHLAVRQTQEVAREIAKQSGDKTVKGTLAALKQKAMAEVEKAEAKLRQKIAQELHESRSSNEEYQKNINGRSEDLDSYSGNSLDAVTRSSIALERTEVDKAATETASGLFDVGLEETDWEFVREHQSAITSLTKTMIKVLTDELDLRVRLGEGNIDNYELESVASQGFGKLISVYEQFNSTKAYLRQGDESGPKKVRFLVLDQSVVNALLHKATSRTYLSGKTVYTANKNQDTEIETGYVVPGIKLSQEMSEVNLDNYDDLHELVDKEPLLATLVFLADREGGLLVRNGQFAIDISHIRPENVRALAEWYKTRSGSDPSLKTISQNDLDQIERVAQYSEQGLVITERLFKYGVYDKGRETLEVELRATYPEITVKQTDDIITVLSNFKDLYDHITRVTAQVQNTSQQIQLEQDLGLIPKGKGEISWLERARDSKAAVFQVPTSPTKTYIDMVDKYSLLSVKEVVFAKEVDRLRQTGAIYRSQTNSPFWQNRAQYFTGKGMYAIGWDFIEGYVEKFPGTLQLTGIETMAGVEEEILASEYGQKAMENPASHLIKVAARLKKEEKVLDSLHFDPTDDVDIKLAKMMLQAAMMRRRPGTEEANELIAEKDAALTQWDQLMKGPFLSFPYANILKGFLIEQGQLQWKPGTTMNDKKVTGEMLADAAVIFRRFYNANKDLSPQRQKDYLLAWRRQGWRNIEKFEDIEIFCKQLEKFANESAGKNIEFEFTHNCEPEGVPKKNIFALQFFTQAVIPYNEGQEAGLNQQFNMGAAMHRLVGRQDIKLFHQAGAQNIHAPVAAVKSDPSHIAKTGLIKAAYFNLTIGLIIGMQMGLGSVNQLSGLDPDSPTYEHERNEIIWAWMYARLQFLAFHANPIALWEHVKHDRENQDWGKLVYDLQFFMAAVKGASELGTGTLDKVITMASKAHSIGGIQSNNMFAGISDHELLTMQRELRAFRKASDNFIWGVERTLETPGMAIDAFFNPIDYTREAYHSFRTAVRQARAGQPVDLASLGFEIPVSTQDPTGMQATLRDAINNPTKMYTITTKTPDAYRLKIAYEHLEGLFRSVITLASQHPSQTIPAPIQPLSQDAGRLRRTGHKISAFLRNHSRRIAHGSYTMSGADLYLMATEQGSVMQQAERAIKQHDPGFRGVNASTQQAWQTISNQLTAEQKESIDTRMQKAKVAIDQRFDAFSRNLSIANNNLNNQIELAAPAEGNYGLRLRGKDMLAILRHKAVPTLGQKIDPINFIPARQYVLMLPNALTKLVGINLNETLSVHHHRINWVMGNIRESNPINIVENHPEFKAFEADLKQANPTVTHKQAYETFIQHKVEAEIIQPATQLTRPDWVTWLSTNHGKVITLLKRKTRLLKTRSLLQHLFRAREKSTNLPTQEPTSRPSEPSEPAFKVNDRRHHAQPQEAEPVKPSVEEAPVAKVGISPETVRAARLQPLILGNIENNKNGGKPTIVRDETVKPAEPTQLRTPGNAGFVRMDAFLGTGRNVSTTNDKVKNGGSVKIVRDETVNAEERAMIDKGIKDTNAVLSDPESVKKLVDYLKGDGKYLLKTEKGKALLEKMQAISTASNYREALKIHGGGLIAGLITLMGAEKIADLLGVQNKQQRFFLILGLSHLANMKTQAWLLSAVKGKEGVEAAKIANLLQNPKIYQRMALQLKGMAGGFAEMALVSILANVTLDVTGVKDQALREKIVFVSSLGVPAAVHFGNERLTARLAEKGSEASLSRAGLKLAGRILGRAAVLFGGANMLTDGIVGLASADYRLDVNRRATDEVDQYLMNGSTTDKIVGYIGRGAHYIAGSAMDLEGTLINPDLNKSIIESDIKASEETRKELASDIREYLKNGGDLYELTHEVKFETVKITGETRMVANRDGGGYYEETTVDSYSEEEVYNFMLDYAQKNPLVAFGSQKQIEAVIEHFGKKTGKAENLIGVEEINKIFGKLAIISWQRSFAELYLIDPSVFSDYQGSTLNNDIRGWFNNNGTLRAAKVEEFKNSFINK